VVLRHARSDRVAHQQQRKNVNKAYSREDRGIVRDERIRLSISSQSGGVKAAVVLCKRVFIVHDLRIPGRSPEKRDGLNDRGV